MPLVPPHDPTSLGMPSSPLPITEYPPTHQRASLPSMIWRWVGKHATGPNYGEGGTPSSLPWYKYSGRLMVALANEELHGSDSIIGRTPPKTKRRSLGKQDAYDKPSNGFGSTGCTYAEYSHEYVSVIHTTVVGSRGARTSTATTRFTQPTDIHALFNLRIGSLASRVMRGVPILYISV